MTELTNADDQIRVFHGDSRDVLKTFPNAHFDSVVCDPPYALVSIVKRFGAENAAPVNNAGTKAGDKGDPYARAAAGFMGQKWDTGETAFAVEFWAEVWRVLKPGGHVIAFSGTRTYHRLACAVEDAGFEIRDMVAWLYGSGFPKSHDVSKGIDKAAGAVRRTSYVPHGDNQVFRDGKGKAAGVERTPGAQLSEPAITDAARQWQGWGTALKPALEPVVMARKPLGTGGANVLDNVERAIRSAGYEGEIVWKPEPANAAAKSAPRPTSSSTEQPPAAETSVAHVGESGTPSAGPPSPSGSAPTGGSGETPTLTTIGKATEPLTPDSGPKSSPHTADAASAAAIENRPSSRSTTSTEAGHSTGSEPIGRSIPRSDDSAFPETPIDSYAGIATGLSGSMAHVRINRDGSGAFLWPAGLPKSVPSTSLTVAANVLQHGTGALNIDASRIGTGEESTVRPVGTGSADGWGLSASAGQTRGSTLGRWPANVIHDGSEEVVGAFPDLGRSQGGGGVKTAIGVPGEQRRGHDYEGPVGFGDSGSAARFFYSAKADAEDRLGSRHPTVKPVDLMAYLVRLVTPPGGLTLDPFAGSGTTGVGAMREGMRCVLIEREDAYVADIMRKLAWARGGGRLTSLELARLDTPEAQAKASGADLPLFG